MNPSLHLLLDLAVIGILLVGIHRFKSPASAQSGNHLASAALALSVVLALGRNGTHHPLLLVLTAVAGAGVGWRLAMRVTMVQIPAMVAFQHGAGGLAAALVAYVELVVAGPQAPGIRQLAGLAGLLVGAATFSGSLIASAKLSGRMRPTPLILPRHAAVALAAGIAAAVCGLAWSLGASAQAVLILAALLAVAGGVLFAIRIGGADMPVLISFLNATAGLAAAACGIILQDRLLIAFGATVAASGSILTRVMCRAMNRNMATVFAGHQGEVNFRPFEMFHKPPSAAAEMPSPPSVPAPPPERDPLPTAIEALARARRVVIIPGYGMALARAQFNVANLASRLVAMGKSVKFAIHPVAGRMPGHMHVLLAEADVDYELLYEMGAINPELADTDAVLVVGACDVVNPAAVQTQNTPISGMPILEADRARSVIVCNLDRKPGYSGVENLLYDDPKTILLLGDANQTTAALLEALTT